MSTVICRHIHINGARCGSPALGGRTLCYHHMKVADCHRSINPPSDGIETILHPIPIEHQDLARRDPVLAAYYGVKPTGPLLLDLPPLEDRESIQIALSMLVTAMAQNRIDAKRASGIVYALQVASNNAHMLRNKPSRSEIVVETVLDEDGKQIAPDVDPESELALQEFVNSAENKEDEEDDEDEEDEEDDDLDEDERL
jgi:hypothetical protein